MTLLLMQITFTSPSLRLLKSIHPEKTQTCVLAPLREI